MSKGMTIDGNLALDRHTVVNLDVRGPLTVLAGRRLIALIALQFDLPEWRDIWYRFRYRARVYPSLTPLAPPCDGLTVAERKQFRQAERTIARLRKERAP